MQVSTQVTTQVEELIKIFTGEHTRQDLQDKLKLANWENFRKNYLQSALDEELIELTIPEKPNSSKQKYRLTEKGIFMKDKSIWVNAFSQAHDGTLKTFEAKDLDLKTITEEVENVRQEIYGKQKS
jgi:hypothetical protein